MTAPAVLRTARQGDELLVSWPTRAGDFLLEVYAVAPETAVWQPVESTTVRSYDTMQTTADIASPACFARLRERRAISTGTMEAVTSMDPNLPVSDVITASLTA